MPPYESNRTALDMKSAPILRPGPRLEVDDGELLCHGHFILQYFYERIPRWDNQQANMWCDLRLARASCIQTERSRTELSN
jgi:hypothetical protein